MKYLFIFIHYNFCCFNLFFQKLDLDKKLHNIAKILLFKNVLLLRQSYTFCFTYWLKEFFEYWIYLATIVKFCFCQFCLYLYRKSQYH